MSNNGNIDNSRVRKVIEPKFQHKYISIILPAVFFIVFAPFIWMLVTTLFDAENTSANKPALVIVLLVVLGILAGIGFLGKWINKRLIRVYLYDKGFQTNKDNQEYYYKNLEYFYIPGVKKNTFVAILYGNAGSEWKFIPGAAFHKKALYPWQEGYIKNVFPDAVANIENGGKEEFHLRSIKEVQKDAIAGVSKRRVKKIGESLPELEKITITKDYISFANEVYNWENHKVEVTPVAIKISDLNGKVILNYGKFAASKLDLLSALISKLNRN